MSALYDLARSGGDEFLFTLGFVAEVGKQGCPIRLHEKNAR